MTLSALGTGDLKIESLFAADAVDATSARPISQPPGPGITDVHPLEQCGRHKPSQTLQAFLARDALFEQRVVADSATCLISGLLGSANVAAHDDARMRAEIGRQLGEIYPEALKQTDGDGHNAMLIALVKITADSGRDLMDSRNFPFAETVFKHVVDASASMNNRNVKNWDELFPQLRQTFSLLYDGFDQVECLANILPASRHRFVIDPDKLDAFEQQAMACGIDAKSSPCAGYLFNEKAYLNGVARGYMVGFEDMDAPLTRDLINRIRAACLGDGGSTGAAAKIYEGAIGIHDFVGGNLTQAGLDEILMLNRQMEQRYGSSPLACEQDIDDQDGWSFGSHATASGVMEGYMDDCIGDYHSALEKIGSDGDGLSKNLRVVALLDLMQKLIRLHPFVDGNGRIFQQILLNRELVRQGAGMTLLRAPSKLHVTSLSEILKHTLEGQQSALRHLKAANRGKDSHDKPNVLAAQCDEYVRHYREKIVVQIKKTESVIPATVGAHLNQSDLTADPFEEDFFQ